MDHDDDDDKDEQFELGGVLTEWDCPDCNANNPCDEKVGAKGVELRCNYCGNEYLCIRTDEGRLKFKEI